MKYSVAISESINNTLKSHLIREDGQEDLCFALYNPSTGSTRHTGLINRIILPQVTERNIHGNVSFNPIFLDRVIKEALKAQMGISFLHSHPMKGWQGMSQDDVEAEMMLAPRIKAATGIPLLGMTIGSDGYWSGRFWVKTKPKTYVRKWCESVRVVGKGIRCYYNNRLTPEPKYDDEFLRTISAWGEQKQSDLSRLNVGIVGLGSVGSIVSEAIIRSGIQNITLIDFDRIEKKNLDRQHSINRSDVGRLKVDVYKEKLQTWEIGLKLNIKAVPYNISSEKGILEALNCDILFSCVDRPLARYILNHLSYGNFIPVIDGGIEASYNEKKLNIEQARWRAFTIGTERRCLSCYNQYTVEDVALEIEGLLDDQHYIQGLSKEHFIHRGENVYAFSLSLSGMLMQQLLSLVLQPKGVFYGAKEMCFVTGNTNQNFPFECQNNCDLHKSLALGDNLNNTLILDYPEPKNRKQPSIQQFVQMPIFIKAIKYLKQWFHRFR